MMPTIYIIKLTVLIRLEFCTGLDACTIIYIKLTLKDSDPKDVQAYLKINPISRMTSRTR